VKTMKTEMWPVSPINQRGDFQVNFARSQAIFAENR
jgi:hypothetical protein